MRGLFTPITKIRRQVFTEVARYAYERDLDENDFNYFYESSYRIIPGEVATYRDSVFKERAIIRERIRLALGLPIRPSGTHKPLTEGMADCATSEKKLELPLVNVIPFACEACPTDRIQVSDNCRKCLAHPCTTVCPVNAVSIGKNAAKIDQEKCIKCGRCITACPYQAILRFGRPCAQACGADAIGSDELGRARIDQTKCVSCGLCIVSCPFAAIADKSEIFQLITAIRSGHTVFAAIAPSFVGQFGPLATPGKVVAGIKALGISRVIEVGWGADVGSLHEAEEFLRDVPETKPFLGTSCCPSWAVFARKAQPSLSHCIAKTHTPMVASARKIKEEHPSARVVFIGPCVAKKLEALDDEVRPFVDYVITFEELMGLFSARQIELSDLEEVDLNSQASKDGRNYAVAGGVADAVINAIHARDKNIQVPVLKADTLQDCRKMLALAKAGKTDGHLLEGMACPGGCVGGPGTLSQIPRATRAVKAFAEASPYATANDNTMEQLTPKIVLPHP
ncbi:MAG: 4Fe-4S binding protein [Clostridiales bacterium]|jgi:[FeFe] hydrogenase (group B1/B3)|nr:4Fe-4S binding protein [Clostridiales bacterium]